MDSVQPYAQSAHPRPPRAQTPPGQPAPAQPAPAQSQPPPLTPGTILLDRYVIQGYISGGGFGHIYKALDNALGYRRAIKEAFYQDPQTRHQFHLEAEFLLNTRHPNLVNAYAVFEQGGRLYMVMDYVDGYTLEEIAIDYIRRTRRALPEAYVLDAVLPVCGALHALHSAPVPIIHRDVKPANVKVNGQGVSILIDLGLAKLHAQGTRTIGAALAFTPGYAPPEQYRASGATDARTDVYGMGATLFYLLTGYQPTEAPARLGSMAVPPLRQLNPEISEETARVVLRAMELEADLRQQSALELERELRVARAALEGPPTIPATGGWDAASGVRCAQCDGVNPPVARHCMRCGALLPAPVGGAEAPAPTSAGEAGARPPSAAPDPIPAAAVSPPEPGAAPAASPRGDAPLSPAQPDPLDGAPPLADEREFPPAPGMPRPPDEWTTSIQPAIPVAAPLRRGPAPAAKPLRAEREAPDGGEPPAEEGEAPAAAAPRPPARPIAASRRDRRSGGGGVPGAVALRTGGPWARALPSLQRWRAETLGAAPPADESEVRAGLAAVLALVLACGALLAIQARWALVLALPALALGHWCLRGRSARPTAEARWLATLGLIVAYTWLLLYSAGSIILALRAR